MIGRKDSLHLLGWIVRWMHLSSSGKVCSLCKGTRQHMMTVYCTNMTRATAQIPVKENYNCLKCSHVMSHTSLFPEYEATSAWTHSTCHIHLSVQCIVYYMYCTCTWSVGVPGEHHQLVNVNGPQKLQLNKCQLQNKQKITGTAPAYVYMWYSCCGWLFVFMYCFFLSFL